jgi:hypothetical protein
MVGVMVAAVVRLGFGFGLTFDRPLPIPLADDDDCGETDAPPIANSTNTMP